MANKYRVTRTRTTLEVCDVEALSEAEAVAAASSWTLIGQSTLASVVLIEQRADVFRPGGFGVYLRRITSDVETARLVADRCRAAGVQWASLMVEASDGYQVPNAARDVYAQAFRAEGIEVGVWSFPGYARSASVEQSVDAAVILTAAAVRINAKIIMLNVEKPYKGKQAELRAFVEGVVDSALPGSSIGVVSYPIPSYHPDLDWSAFRVLSWGSPMFYETAKDPELVARGFSEWLAYVPTIVPSLDGWSGTGVAGAARFREDTENVCGIGTARTPGAVVWSESQLDDPKRAVIRSLAHEYGWPTP